MDGSRSTTRESTGSVTVRALRMLDAFLPGSSALTLTDLAASAGLPLSTAHRLAGDLVAWGALERLDTGRYQIGAKLRQVASNAPRAALLREACLPHLEDLAELTGYAALLAILDDTTLVYLEQASGSASQFAPLVQQPPTLAAAAGRVLAAFAPQSTQEAILRQPIPRLTRYTQTDPVQLRGELADTRRVQYAFAQRQVEADHSVIAAPVRGRSGAVTAAISLTVPYDDAETRTLIAMCLAAARAASRTLGT